VFPAARYGGMAPGADSRRLDDGFVRLLWELRQGPNCQGLQEVEMLWLLVDLDPRLIK
jgi:hypothetical protein